jgi:eight-cysteine-cluster-containing protein
MRVGSYQNYLNYDRNNKAVEANIVINCCGVNTSVEKHEKTYFIYEKQYGDLCRCLCNKKIIIFNVENDAKVVFVSYDNKKTILSPNLEFCGISTYSECKTDEDCIITGCSNQICQSKNEEELMTTCEFRECFDASKFKVSCKCIDNKCQWN